MSRAAASLICLLVLVSCSPLPDVEELRRELRQADYGPTSVEHRTTDGHGVLIIRVGTPDGVPTDVEVTEVAEIVLTTYKPPFDELVITIDDQRLMDATTDELTQRFGEHPTRTRHFKGIDIPIFVATLVMAALLAGSVVLIWWHGRRRPSPVPPPYPQQQFRPPL
ncbi:hypothetical protein [Actinophytocola sp.]|uniref:hypothetical protein n=1 Tax=Actinophytocola sp. TaxID=1872138 RepID=UPI002ED21F27